MASLDRPARHYAQQDELALTFSVPDDNGREVTVEVEKKVNPATQRIQELSGQLATANSIIHIMATELLNNEESPDMARLPFALALADSYLRKQNIELHKVNDPRKEGK